MGKMDKRYMPLREFQGRDEQRRNIERQCYVDSLTLNQADKRTHFPTNHHGDELGWSGSPPNLPSGSEEREQTERTSIAAYRANYELIDWGEGG